jgi:hypothetical protein
MGQRHNSSKGIVSVGFVIAVICSWTRNASVLYAFLHGLCNWGYVIYFALTR